MLLLALAWILADAQADANASLLQYGAVGAMLVLLLLASATGLIIWKPGADWLKDQIKQVQAVNSNLLTQVQSAVPALSGAVEAMRSMAEALKDTKVEMSSAMRSMADALKEVRAESAHVRSELADMRKELEDTRRELRDLKQGR